MTSSVQDQIEAHHMDCSPTNKAGLEAIAASTSAQSSDVLEPGAAVSSLNNAGGTMPLPANADAPWLQPSNTRQTCNNKDLSCRSLHLSAEDHISRDASDGKASDSALQLAAQETRSDRQQASSNSSQSGSMVSAVAELHAAMSDNFLPQVSPGRAGVDVPCSTAQSTYSMAAVRDDLNLCVPLSWHVHVPCRMHMNQLDAPASA